MAKPDLDRDSRPTTAETRPVVVTTAPRSPLGVAVQVVVLLLLLTMLGAVLFVSFAVVSLVNVPNQVAGGVGGVASQASRALSSAEQTLQNVTDPNRPPVGLTYDTEFAAVEVWHIGDGLPGGTQYVLTIQSIKRRPGTDSPDTAQYAVVHAELRQPRETRILGQLVRSDSDARDWVVYKGETFRIGRALYRVNWISQEENAVAAGLIRRPDALTQTLKFEYD